MLNKNMKKNIQYTWSIICSGIITAQENNNISLFNVIDQIRINEKELGKIKTANNEEKPSIPIVFNLVTLWRKSGQGLAKGTVVIEMKDPKGIMRQKGEYDIEIPEQIKRTRSIMQWNGMRVTDSGTYTFEISFKESGQKMFEKVGEAFLDVEVVREKDSSGPLK